MESKNNVSKINGKSYVFVERIKKRYILTEEEIENIYQYQLHRHNIEIAKNQACDIVENENALPHSDSNNELRDAVLCLSDDDFDVLATEFKKRKDHSHNDDSIWNELILEYVKDPSFKKD
jgi:hypothetical protein